MWGEPGSHCRAAPSTHGASSDAPALSPIRGWWLHQHLHLQLGGQPAQEPRGIRLRPTTLIACGPLRGAQPLLSPHPLHRTGQSPEPSVTAPLPSLRDKEGSAQTQDGFAGLSHPRVVPARPSPCLPARVQPHNQHRWDPGTGATGLSPCPPLPEAAARHETSWVQGSSLLTPAESQGISRLWEKTGTSCVQQQPGSPRHCQSCSTACTRAKSARLGP